jgi:hypothetical protein
VVRLLTARDLAAAANAHRKVAPEIAVAEPHWPDEPLIRALGGYQQRNAYLLKHWNAIEAGQAPYDKLLDEAEQRFLDAALVDPQDVSVLSGLASILMFKRELDAAAFFNERALELSKLQPNTSHGLEQDRQLIAEMRRQAAPRAPEAARSSMQKPSVAKSSKAARAPVRPSRKIKMSKTSRKMAPKKK